MKIENWGNAYTTLPRNVFDAGYDYVDAMRPHADANDGPVPLWLGWALRYAFWSGWKYAKDSA